MINQEVMAGIMAGIIIEVMIEVMIEDMMIGLMIIEVMMIIIGITMIQDIQWIIIRIPDI